LTSFTKFWQLLKAFGVCGTQFSSTFYLGNHEIGMCWAASIGNRIEQLLSVEESEPCHAEEVRVCVVAT